jgi:hypothetical protein
MSTCVDEPQNPSLLLEPVHVDPVLLEDAPLNCAAAYRGTSNASAADAATTVHALKDFVISFPPQIFYGTPGEVVPTFLPRRGDRWLLVTLCVPQRTRPLSRRNTPYRAT